MYSALRLTMFDTLPIEILYLSANVRYDEFSPCPRINCAFSERVNVRRFAIMRGEVNMAPFLLYRHDESVIDYWSWLFSLFFTDDDLSQDE